MRGKHLCFHLASDVNEGQYRRIRKLQNDFVRLTGFRYLEIQVVGILAFLKGHRSLLQTPSAVAGGRKLLLPILLPGARRLGLVRFLNHALCVLAGAAAGLWYRPDTCIGETQASYSCLQGVRLASRTARVYGDLHGAFAEEVAYSSGAQPWAAQFIAQADRRERDLLELADALISQSVEMFLHLEEKHRMSLGCKVVYQCGVDTEIFAFSASSRKAVRSELGIGESDTVFVYLGGMHSWQMIDQVFQIFAQYLSLAQGRSSKLLFLTSEAVGSVLACAARFGIPPEALRVRCVPHAEVPGFLSACDLGFLLREDTTLNRVACPTKLGEYLACGVPVVSTEIARHWSWTRENPAAVCIVDHRDPAAAGAIAGYLEEMGGRVTRAVREECCAIAARELSMQYDFRNLESFIHEKG